MEENKTSEALIQAQNRCMTPEVISMQAQWAVTVQTAQSMQLQENSCAAFQAVAVVQMLRQALTDGVMKQVFMPLMNTKIGFKTDKDPKRPGKNGAPTPYGIEVVRDCLVDAMCIGLLPTGNQFNIIAGQMYPTKEGYTALLKHIGCKYIITVGQDQQRPDAQFAEIPCKINYERNGDKGGYTFIATVKKDSYSSMDQLRGKAERRAKKSLYEYLTGCDFGEADEDSSAPAEAQPAPQPIGFGAQPAAQIQMQPEPQPQPQPQVMMQQSQPTSTWRQRAQSSPATPQRGF